MLLFQTAVFAATMLTTALGGRSGPVENNPCARPLPGSVVSNPPDLFSNNGILRVDFSYNTTTDAYGRTLYCFGTPDGEESPTLHVHPGDHLVIKVKNNLPLPSDPNGMALEVAPADREWCRSPRWMATSALNVCGNPFMTPTSVNLHFHGTNTPPKCHQDEVLHTMVNSGDTFTYDLAFPANQPSGLYWYHPHIHGLAEAQCRAAPVALSSSMGSRMCSTRWRSCRSKCWSSAIRMSPILRVQRSQRTFVGYFAELRADSVSGLHARDHPDGAGKEAILARGECLGGCHHRFATSIRWPAADAAGRWARRRADRIAGRARRGKIVNMTDHLVAPAARAEFIVMPPSSTVKNATLMTLGVDTGPQGDFTPPRRLAIVNWQAVRAAHVEEAHRAARYSRRFARSRPQRFDGLATATPTAHRTLYFSETPPTPGERDNSQTFFITVEGAIPTAFDPANPPSITTTQGSVEDWTIANRARGPRIPHPSDSFSADGEKWGSGTMPEEQQYLDEVTIPYFSGRGPRRSVTVRMDFRGPLVGDFMYHCHILGHEDNGMMAIIRVSPRGEKVSTKSANRS